MRDWAGFWIALALLFLAFSPSNCGGTSNGTDSIATATVKYLEK